MLSSTFDSAIGTGLVAHVVCATLAAVSTALVGCSPAAVDCKAEPESGECAAVPELLTKVGGSVTSIVSEGDRLYWIGFSASDGTGATHTISSIVQDGTGEKLVARAPGAWVVAVDGEDVFWGTANVTDNGELLPLTVMKQAKEGGAPMQLYEAPGFPSGLAVDVTQVAVAIRASTEMTFVAGQVVLVPRQGGTPTTLISDVTPSRVSLGAGRVYWGDFARDATTGVYINGGIEAVPLAGGPNEVMATGFQPQHLAVSQSLYAAGCDLEKVVDNCNYGDAWVLVECPLSGCGPGNALGKVYPLPQMITGMAADESGVYYLLGRGTGVPRNVALMKRVPGAAEPEVLVNDMPLGSGLVMTPAYFFWGGETPGGGYGIWRLKR